MNWQVVSIVLAAFMFIGNFGMSIYSMIATKVSKKDEKNQTLGELLLMKSIDLVKSDLLGVITPLQAGMATIAKGLEEGKIELKERQKEAREKSDQIREMSGILRQVLEELQDLKHLPEQVKNIERENVELRKMYIEIMNEFKKK